MKPERERYGRVLLLISIVLAIIIYLIYDIASLGPDKATLPQWIYRLEPSLHAKVSPTDRICVNIALNRIWEIGDQPEKLANEIAVGLTISVNGNLTTPRPGGILGELEEVRDKNGNVIGQTFDQLEQCFLIDLEAGTYNSTIEIKRKQGKIYTFSWTFEVTNNVATNTP